MRHGPSRIADNSSLTADRSNSALANQIASAARPRRDPRRVEYLTVAEQVYSTIYAAFKGDLTNLRRDFLRGVDMCGADYDGRYWSLFRDVFDISTNDWR